MKIIRNKIKGGMYNNVSEVVRDAIRRIDEHDNIRYQYKLEQLRKALKPGIEDVKNGRMKSYTSYEDFKKDILGE